MTGSRTWLRIGSAAAFGSAAAALVAAAAGGITEPTGIATVAAMLAAVVAYGLAPLVITVAMRQSACPAGPPSRPPSSPRSSGPLSRCCSRPPRPWPPHLS